MNAIDLIRQAESVGITLCADGDKLIVRSKNPPPQTLIQSIKQSKPILLDYCHRQDVARRYFDLVAERMNTTTENLLALRVIEPCDLDDVAEGRIQGSPEQMAALLKTSYLWPID